MNDVISPGQFHRICQVVVNGKVPANNQANLNVISSWVAEDQGEVASDAWFKKVLAEHPRYAAALVWQSADVLDPAKRREAATAQADEDRKTFNSFARANGFSEAEANFSLACSILGSGFNEHDLEQAVQSNALSLALASPAELERFRQEYQQQRQDYLIHHASPEQLRQAAKAESAERRTQAQREEQQRQIEHRQQLDAEYGFDPLPETNTAGINIDSKFLKALDASTFKKFCRRYGMAQITSRLNGR